MELDNSCTHSWVTGTGPSDPADTGVHMCQERAGHDSEHVCRCGATGQQCEFCGEDSTNVESHYGRLVCDPCYSELMKPRPND